VSAYTLTVASGDFRKTRFAFSGYGLTGCLAVAVARRSSMFRISPTEVFNSATSSESPTILLASCGLSRHTPSLVMVKSPGENVCD
jgi:hypothetical protein